MKMVKSCPIVNLVASGTTRRVATAMAQRQAGQPVLQGLVPYLDNPLVVVRVLWIVLGLLKPFLFSLLYINGE